MRKPVSIRKDLLTCHWSGRILGSVEQRVDCAVEGIRKGNLHSAAHNLYVAKMDLERADWAIGKNTAKKISKLLDEPYQAVKKAINEGENGHVSDSKLRVAERALSKAMNKASNKCQ